jgi:methylated-DNA-protein-cysteine methyltransferase-like protein
VLVKPSSKIKTHDRIYAVVARIPKGKVATYGQVARLAGLHRQARLVGYALNVLPEGSALPWHRVVNVKGQISERSSDSGSEGKQKRQLVREGVRFAGDVIPLTTHLWKP